MIIRGMKGLGDCIYQRAFVRRLGECWLETPWPELYADLPGVRFVRPNTTLRTQAKNMQRQASYQPAPYGMREVQVSYPGGAIIDGMSRCFGMPPADLDMPQFPRPACAPRQPYVVVRPATARAEWRADTRNPDPAYLCQAAQAAIDAGSAVVSVADLADGAEWIVGDAPPATARYHGGELSVSELLGLVQHAAGLIGGIGWLLPAAMACRVSALIVCGGQGGYNSPAHVTHSAVDSSTVTFAVPDRLCMCTQKQHHCDKRISDYESVIAGWVGKLPAVV